MKHTKLIIWNLLCIMPVLGMAIDLVAPSLPAIATDLNISSGIAKDVISIYLFAYAFGNFFAGFLTDALGRRLLLRLGLAGFMIASFAPLFFPTIEMVLFARFLQGISIGFVSVVLRSIFSDILEREELLRLGPVIATMWGLGPVIGPVIGGYLQFYFGWQAGFCFFGIISLILLTSVYFIIPETHFNRHPLNFMTIKKNFHEIFTHQLFIALSILMGLSYSLLIIFNTLGPFLIQTKFHYSPITFGHIALLLGFVFLISTIICRHFLKYFKLEQLQLLTINFFFLISIILVGAGYLFSDSISLVVIGSMLMFFACGIIFPMSMGQGLSLFKHIAGTATAIMFLINILITSLTAFIASFMNTQNAVTLMWVYFLLMFISAGVYWKMIKSSI